MLMQFALQDISQLTYIGSHLPETWAATCAFSVATETLARLNLTHE